MIGIHQDYRPKSNSRRCGMSRWVAKETVGRWKAEARVQQGGAVWLEVRLKCESRTRARMDR